MSKEEASGGFINELKRTAIDNTHLDLKTLTDIKRTEKRAFKNMIVRMVGIKKETKRENDKERMILHRQNEKKDNEDDKDKEREERHKYRQDKLDNLKKGECVFKEVQEKGNF